MKWFKHQSMARNDEKISRLEDKCGLEGYGFYFKMLEIVAEVVDSTDKCDVTYSMSRWGRQTNVTTKKWLYLAQCCADVGLMMMCRGADEGLTNSCRGADDITINIPNLLKYRDNHTKNLQATCKQELEEDTEEEEDIDIHKKRLQTSFDNFYKCYPKKVGKTKALSAWKKLKPNDDLVEKIIDAVEKSKLTHGWIKDGGEFIPYPASWLNAKRWEDEIDIVPIRVVEVVKEKRYFN